MKVPLEPIPTEQIVLVETDPPRAEIRRHEHGGKESVISRQSNQLDKAYPWLLGASCCLSAMLCWMYVTKPVITQSAEPQVSPSVEQAVVAAADSVMAPPKTTAAAESSEPAADLLPSDNILPGANPPTASPSVASTSVGPGGPQTPQAITPGVLAKSHAGGDGSHVALGWETTNLKVQHILSADAGSGDLEKIVLNVPVLYETRTMRWTPGDIANARNVMGRLMVYERNLNNLRREGQAILKDWNDLLENTVPTPALRADSPSLPYNHGQGSLSGTLPGSSSVIKVEH